MILEFSVDKQTITRTDENKPVEKSKNYLYCQFNFSDDWSEVVKTAIFTSAKGDVVNVILEDDACVVPWEVNEYPHFSVSVFGGDLITANRVVVQLAKSGYSQGNAPSEPTPDVYTQILNSVKAPYIGENGNWYLWAVDSRAYVDSGYSSQGQGIVDDFLSLESENAIANKVATREIENLWNDIGGVRSEVGYLDREVIGIRQQINNHAHFKGYFSTNAKIQETEATPNDFAYSAESGTKWVYDKVEGWQDTGVHVPDQLTPASETVPLVNGEATTGEEEAYARGDHRHPSDPSKVNVTEFNETMGDIGNAIESIIAIQNSLIGGDA